MSPKMKIGAIESIDNYKQLDPPAQFMKARLGKPPKCFFAVFSSDSGLLHPF
jgi:hypothetical protein